MIDLINVSLQFGGKYLFREVSFKINSGDRISLVGANGTGKSSLTDIIELQKKETEITEKLSDTSISEEERDDLIHQLGEVHHRLDELGSYSIGSKVEKILLGIGFDIEEFEKLTNEFSGGWQMRIDRKSV